MLGYHDCPPHPLESLEHPLDRPWLLRAPLTKERIEELLREAAPGVRELGHALRRVFVRL